MKENGLPDKCEPWPDRILLIAFISFKFFDFGKTGRNRSYQNDPKLQKITKKRSINISNICSN
jgi:hypothetical protein